MLLNFDGTPDFREGQLILIDKPLRWTSFDVVNKVRFLLQKGLKLDGLKVGHAGTLDPLASGLVMLLTGKGTKKIEQFQAFDKEYVAEVEFGKTTPSFDLETAFDGTYPTGHITAGLIQEVLHRFEGESEQIPPVHSAKMINGKRAYSYARKGKDVEMKPQTIRIEHIELLEFNHPVARIRVICSKGTYIRSLSRDIGLACGSGAYMKGLRRTLIGPYHVDDALGMEDFEKKIKDYLKQNEQLSV
jgi:tRNA pseudouridine55 synthase